MHAECCLERALFSVEGEYSWLAYSIDNLANVTMAGNTTLTGLSDGFHSLVVYANDTSGNTGVSETFYFKVEVPEPFPTTLVIASVITVSVVGVGLLVYFKKRKH